MKKMNAAALAAATVGFVGATASADSVSFDFSSPLQLNDNQTAGAWYTDRYAPEIFEAQPFGPASDGTALRQGVRENGFQGNRGGQNSDFYNYQGRKYDLGLDVNSTTSASVQIDMYVDGGWNPGMRAGMWATGSNGNLSYPIIEYVVGADDGNGGSFTGFRYWNSANGGSWTTTSFENPTTEMWYTLQIVLDDTDVNFYINGSHIDTIGNLGADSIDNVILQAHNQGAAGEYDVWWDNFNAMTTVIPLPGAAGMALAGMGMIGLRRRR